MNSEKGLLVKICPHCGHKWIARVENPRKCPKCGRWLNKEG